jgi:hypothetical protein
MCCVVCQHFDAAVLCCHASGAEWDMLTHFVLVPALNRVEELAYEALLLI